MLIDDQDYEKAIVNEELCEPLVTQWFCEH